MLSWLEMPNRATTSARGGRPPSKAAAAGSDVGRRLLLLLGPPSGGKSTLAILLKRGLEEYSRTDEGALYAALKAYAPAWAPGGKDNDRFSSDICAIASAFGRRRCSNSANSACH